MSEVMCWNRRSYMGSSVANWRRCRGRKMAMAKRCEYKKRNRINNCDNTRTYCLDKRNNGKNRQDARWK